MREFSEVTEVSFVQKIKNALSGTIIGLLLFIGAFFLLWWNEGNCVKNAQMYDFIKKNVLSVDSSSISPANNNRLIHVSGQLNSIETLGDGVVSVKNAVSLVRNVEMYQWVESKHTNTKKNSGGSSTKTTTYSYDTKWSSTPVNSSNFKKSEGHNNPAFEVAADAKFAKNVSLGAFKLTPEFISKLGANTKLENLPQRANCKVVSGYYYCGNDPSAPVVGDYKINYVYTPSDTMASVIGAQYNGYITRAMTPSGEFFASSLGIVPANSIIKSFETNNIIMTNVVRICGIAMIWIGLSMLIAPLTVLADFFPILGYIVESISGIILGLVSLLLGLIVIALAWLSYRPFIAVIVIALMSYLIYMIIKKRKPISPSEA